MSTIKVDTIATRTGSGNITASNTIAGTSATLSGTLGVTGAITGTTQTLNRSGNGVAQTIQSSGTTIGTIGISDGDNLFITGQTGNTGGIFMNDAAVSPAYQGVERDNHYDLGKAPARWKDLYLSGGLKVGGTGAANTLDDYEEGTFEVVITGTSGGTATGNSGAGAGASYVKIGETVFYRGYFANPVISGTLNGSLRLALPFTNRNTDRFDNGSGGFIVGHREISSGTTSNEITLKTGRGENFARLRRKYTVNSRLEDVDLTQGNASINSSTLLWFQGTLKV